MFMTKWLILLMLPLQLFAFNLKDEIKKAQKGDFIVYSYKQSLVLLRVAGLAENELVIEEVSGPLHSIEQKNWQEWLQNGAPLHTSWTISTIDIANGKVRSIFSIDEKKYLNSNPSLQFLPTLLQLSFHTIDPAERKMVGAAPLPGEIDTRHLWLPKIVFQGKQIHPFIAAYKVFWPKDESELAGKALDLYFAEKEALSYLPYWIEVASGVTKAKILALDSGKQLASPHTVETYEQPQKVAL